VTTIARHGRAIILGRGGNLILGEQADLRVRLYAPTPLRVANLREYENLSEAEAVKEMEKIDERRRQFVERLFGADIQDPHLYDLAINTARFSPADCVEVIAEALKARLPSDVWKALTETAAKGSSRARK